MADKEVWTVGRLLTWTTDYLSQHGADSPRLDAEVLLAWVMDCQRIELYTRFEEDPGDDVRSKFRELVKQRAEGRPVAQIVGSREFYSMAFDVTTDVLIPRPETEHLVVRLLDLVKDRGQDSPLRIADIGTGSGIIAICVAKHLKKSSVMAIDLSPQALALARQNAEKHEVADRITFVESDLFAAVDPSEKFDIIASNPPYIAEGDTALEENVLRYEPRMALIAVSQGTEVIERILKYATERLVPGGRLLIEISPFIHDEVCKLIDAQDGLTRLPTILDLKRNPRIVEAELAG